jgi:SAM-dependent methyltransferase
MGSSPAPPERDPAFRDHFSKHSGDYATYRPHYPPSLFAWLAGQAERHELAWDAGAGTGQASVALAEHFRHVIATDASAAQIDRAEPHPRVEYRVARAEASGIPGGTADLVMAAQALHWFDVNEFFAEARRVAAARGVVAVCTYGRLATGAPALDRVFDRFYDDVVGPWWPPERRLVETGYATLPFPFAELLPPAFEMTALWTLREVLGYIGTWSATARLRAATSVDPIQGLEAEAAPAWGPVERREVHWPLTVRAGRCT